jgi:transposase
VALEGADRASDAVAVMVDRQRSAAATGAVVAQRREAEGMTNREIRRCLVRYVARQLYRLLEQPARFDATWERPRE